MTRVSDIVLDEFDRPVQNAQVYVLKADGTQATLTLDGGSSLAQPVNTDSFGSYYYNTNDAIYQREIWYGGKKRWVEQLTQTTLDASLRTDLSSSGGSALVSWLPGGSSPASVTLQTALRRGLEVTPAQYGAVGDETTDDITALQAFWTDVIANNLPHDCSGKYAISTVLTIGPNSAPASVPPLPLNGRMKLTALSAMNEMVRLKNMPYRRWHGGLWCTGIGSASFASRTCLIGTYIENCARMEISDGIFGDNFALANAYFGTANNNMMKIGGIKGSNIGSGQVGNSLTANWSAPSNTGSSNSTAQRTVLNISAFPSTAITGYDPVGTSQIQLRIAGYLYYVYAIDRNAGTATIYPWIDNTSFSAGTGSCEWVFGGNYCTRSSDSNLIEVARLDASSVGRNLSEQVLYGSIIRDMQTNGAGTEICLASGPGSACSGTTILGRYNEVGGASSEQINILARFGTSNFHLFLGDSGAEDLSKCWATGDPRATAGQIVGGEFGAQGTGSISITKFGRLLSHLKPNLAHGPGATLTLAGQSRSPLPEVYALNSHNLQLSVQGAGEYNRLFGYSGGVVGYIGTGTNGAPTGSFVFTPPSGGTINGGSVDATATFSGFDGPAIFSYEHTDTAQLTWLVRPVTGRNRAGLPGTAVKGDADVTLTAFSDKVTQRFTTTLTAGRAVTLSTTGAVEGNRFKIARPATGAFNLSVGTGPLKALAAGTWCEVEYDGSAWQLIANGSL